MTAVRDRCAKPGMAAVRGVFALLCAACVLVSGCAIGAGTVPQAGKELTGKPYRQAGVFVIAPENTTATFEVSVVDLISVKGQFHKVAGTLTLGDDGRPAGADVTIESASADAGMQEINDMLRGPKFFNADKFPNVVYHSLRLRADKDSLGLDGQLTVLGVTRDVTLKVDRFDCRQNGGRAFCVADAQTTIKRSDFGMTTWSDTVADEIKIEVKFTAQQKVE